MPRFSKVSAFVCRRLLRRRWRIPSAVRKSSAADADLDTAAAPLQPAVVVDTGHVILPPHQTLGDQLTWTDDIITENIVAENVSAQDTAKDAPLDDVATKTTAPKEAEIDNAAANNAGTEVIATKNRAAVDDAAADDTAVKNAANKNNACIDEVATESAATQSSAVNNVVPVAQPAMNLAASPTIPQAVHSHRPTALVVHGGRLLQKVETIREASLLAQRTARMAQVAGDIVQGRLHLVYFTDGSRGESKKQMFSTGGYSVVAKIPGTNANGWLGVSFNMLSCFDTQQAELSGVTEALAMAVQYIDQHDIYDAIVRIFTDSIPCIDTVRKGVSTRWYTGGFVDDILRPVLMRLSRLSERLEQRRSKIEIHWLKRSTNNKNIEADRLALDARVEGDIPHADRSPATRDLDEEVEKLVERWLQENGKKKKKPLSWDHEEFTQESIDRLFALRRMKLDPESWSIELELELRTKENLVGWRI